MYEAIVKKEFVSNIDTEKVERECVSNYVTIVDEDYPKRLNHVFRPPFVFYYKGDLSLLKEGNRNVVVLNGKNASNYATKSILSIIDGMQEVDAIVIPVSAIYE